MKKEISLNYAANLSKKLHNQGKKLVITGGCFDILHIGHIKLLEASKKEGDVLLVLIENDKTVKKLKGNDRPLNKIKDRVSVLSAIFSVDYILILPDMKSNADYDILIKKIKPDIITTTKGNPQAKHNKRQAKLVGAKVKLVINKINNKSTTKLAQIIFKNFK